MSKEMTLIVLGLFVAILPFLGIFTSWKTPLFVLAGLGVMLLGFLLRGEVIMQSAPRERTENHPFVESGDVAAHE